ncbi:hypothetical protein GQ55_8G247900 [Panicum hallii var. hallii]|uniref:Uncharacterized protein n=1 Tax=Panicum hallii var. hallii TaxID=1504633 RepID=A0A2T7CQX4_9POAL|nr:hypothetical protein GQ55_8G247900 [Panicum hallii var. hallii]
MLLQLGTVMNSQKYRAGYEAPSASLGATKSIDASTESWISFYFKRSMKNAKYTVLDYRALTSLNMLSCPFSFNFLAFWHEYTMICLLTI